MAPNRITTGEDNDRPEIDRLQLRQMLLDSLPAHRVGWGKVLLNADCKGSTTTPTTAADWVLSFADGSRESGFRLIVGADGAWRKLRQLLSPITPATPRYSGKMFIEGRLSQSNPQYAAALEMVGAGNSMAMGTGCALCIQQMSDRSYRVYMGLEAPETLTRPGGDADLTDMDKARRTVAGFYADWGPQLRAFIAAAEGPWRPWPLYRLDADVFSPEAQNRDDKTGKSSWARTPGVVLIGDAMRLTEPLPTARASTMPYMTTPWCYLIVFAPSYALTTITTEVAPTTKRPTPQLWSVRLWRTKRKCAPPVHTPVS